MYSPKCAEFMKRAISSAKGPHDLYLPHILPVQDGAGFGVNLVAGARRIAGCRAAFEPRMIVTDKEAGKSCFEFGWQVEEYRRSRRLAVAGCFEGTVHCGKIWW